VGAWYQPKKGREVVDWLPWDKPEFPEFLSEKSPNRVGEWRYFDNPLKITRIGQTEEFKVTSNAFWKGLGDNIHVGEIVSQGTLNKSIIKLKQDDCELKLNLVLHYLVVSDNLQCGGLNVTFSGVYLKKSTG
jgi:hypothetical protein